MKVIASAVGVVCFSLSTFAPADSTLALACLGCHQSSINSPEMPALGRLSPTRIAAALRQARDQPLPGSIMARFAKAMTDTEIDALANELGKAAP